MASISSMSQEQQAEMYGAQQAEAAANTGATATDADAANSPRGTSHRDETDISGVVVPVPVLEASVHNQENKETDEKEEEEEERDFADID